MDHCTYPGASVNDTTENGVVRAARNGFARVDGAGRTYLRGPNPLLRHNHEPLILHVLKDQSLVVVVVVVVGVEEACPPLDW